MTSPAPTSLPPAWFVGDANLPNERHTIWNASWVSVARAEDLAHPGSFVTASIAGNPVVVVRGKDGELRAMSNVCTHRGSTLVDGAGTASALQCPYHGWTFRLNGELAAAPQMPGLETADHCLPVFAVEVWQGWVFVNLDDAAVPLRTALSELDELVEPYDLAGLRRVGTIESVVDVNWKLVVENFAESYHHASVHPVTLHKDFPGHKSRVAEHSGQPWMWLDHESTNDDVEPFAVVLAFPAHMFTIIRAIGMDWIKLEVLSPTQTRLVSELFLPEHLCENDALIAMLLKSMEEVNAEDSACLERVQTGLSSQWAPQGPVSPLEKGCDQFRTWLRSRLAPPS